MRHRLVIGIALIAGLAGISPTAQEAPSESQMFRGAVDLVTIQASVRDARGRVVSGLTTTDFEVRDNGQLRADPLAPLRPTVAAQPGHPGRHERQHEHRPEDQDGAPGLRIRSCRSSIKGRMKWRCSPSMRPCTSGFDFTRDLVALKGALSEFDAFGTTSLYDADGRRRSTPCRALCDQQGDHRAHRRHRYQQRR
jgi:hypothetical protein